MEGKGLLILCLRILFGFLASSSILIFSNELIEDRNKVFVFTGILPICQTEDGLATILGHGLPPRPLPLSTN